MKNGFVMRDIRIMLMIIGMICVSGASASLDTETYGFYNITNNSAANALAGEAQLSIEVSNQGTIMQDGSIFNLVGFKFMNEGPDYCTIAEIYFQDGSDLLFDFDSIDESLMINGERVVDFKEEEIGNISPKNLPGGKSITPKFIATTGFSIEPESPEPTWGVEPGEWVKIVYALQSGKMYSNVIDELNAGDLRIGIHVQAFDNGGSESFVNVPEPATIGLLAIGGLLLRKRRKVSVVT